VNLTDLEGLITPEVGDTLARYASQVPPTEAVVEVGSYKGKSTCYLAAGAGPNGAKVYAFDAWDLAGNQTGRFGFADPTTYEVFRSQVKAMHFSRRIKATKTFGHVAAQTWGGPPVGLLFVDADHEAGSVIRDGEAWTPHLAAGATVILDDLDTPKNPGVRVAADHLARTWGPYEVEAERLAVFRP